jgi:hypothetical protein
MPIIEKGQITVGKGRGIGSKRLDMLWILIKVPSPISPSSSALMAGQI